MTTFHFNTPMPATMRQPYRELLHQQLTIDERAKLELIWKNLDEMRYGKWPDPNESEAKTQEWINRVHRILHSYFLKRNVQRDAARELVKEVKDILQAQKRYDLDYVRDMAGVSYQFHKEGKGRHVLDLFKDETEMAKSKVEITPRTEKQKASDTEYIQSKASSLVLKMASAEQKVKYPANDQQDIRGQVYEMFGGKGPQEAVAHIAYDEDKALAEHARLLTIWQNAQKADGNGKKESELDKEFPRCKKCNQPLDIYGGCETCNDPGAYVPLDESKSPDEGPQDERDFGPLFETAHNLGYSDEEVHTFFGGVKSMKEVPGLVNELTTKFAKANKPRNGSEDKPAKAESEKAVENTPPINGKAAPMNETKPPQEKLPEISKSTESAQIAPPINEGKRQMSEAPFSANFRMMNTFGIEVQFTIRDEKVKDGVDKLEKLIPLLIERGYTPSNGNGRGHSQPASQPDANGNGHSAPAMNEGGTAACAMIEVGTTYTGGKPQLKFSCDGLEHPLGFAKPTGEMVKLLSKVKQASGAPFTANDLGIGRKFGGAWRVVWKPYRNEKDGKTYNNVLEVLPA